MQTSNVRKSGRSYLKLLTTLCVVDVRPTLATYLHARGSSALDRYLVPEEWVSTARWNPEVRTLCTSQTNGHKISKLNVRARPTVLNNPRDAKHETIPTEAFMPRKNGRVPKDNRSLQSLLRLLHRTHQHLFRPLSHSDGFRLTIQDRNPTSLHATMIPPFNGNDIPHQLLPLQFEGNSIAARELHSTRNDYGHCLSVNNDAQTFAARELHSTRNNHDNHYHCSGEESQDSHLSNRCYSPSAVSATRASGENSDDCSVRVVCNAHLSISSCYWSWWRSLPAAGNPAQVRPYLKARKFVHLPAQWVNVPKPVVEDLILQSQGAILANLDGLIISNGSVALPRSIQAMFEVIDDYLTGIPYVPSDSTDSQVRGLGCFLGGGAEYLPKN